MAPYAAGGFAQPVESDTWTSKVAFFFWCKMWLPMFLFSLNHAVMANGKEAHFYAERR